MGTTGAGEYPATPVYGPPPDPTQILAETDFGAEPLAWMACVSVGVTLAVFATPRRPFLFVLGLVLALTTPLAAYLPTYVYGAFPTIDKAGSLAFYLDGVHTRMFDPDDPGMRLIGIHVGHLWITAAFDLILAPFAAMNAQGVLNLALSWWAAALLLDRWCRDRWVALLLAFPFAMGLHQFRDLNWYTIEKTSLYWLPLYLWALTRVADRDPISGVPQAPRSRWDLALPAVFAVGAFFTNLYVGILCGLAGAMALLLRDRRLALAAVISAVAVLPMGAWQWALMHGAGSLGSPETFLTERAALDTLSLWPPLWNRLELWRAVNLVAVGLAVWGARAVPRLWVGVAVCVVLALGPTHNPVYLALYHVVPGFWRVAKPETFFHLGYLLLLGAAAVTLARRRPTRRQVLALAALFAVGWVAGVRTHPVYPRFTNPTEVHLAPTWERAIPGFDE